MRRNQQQKQDSWPKEARRREKRVRTTAEMKMFMNGKEEKKGAQATREASKRPAKIQREEEDKRKRRKRRR